MKCVRHSKWGRDPMVSEIDKNGKTMWYCQYCWQMFRGNMPPALFEAKLERQKNDSTSN